MNSLSDQELMQLDQQLEELPAGGSALRRPNTPIPDAWLGVRGDGEGPQVILGVVLAAL